MKNKKAIITGVLLGAGCAVALATGTEAAEAVAENGFVETLETIATFLPWPWNVVAGGLITIGGALFAWKKKAKNSPSAEELKSGKA